MKETTPERDKKETFTPPLQMLQRSRNPYKNKLTNLPETLHLQVKGKAQPKKNQERRRGRTPSQPPHDPKKFPQVTRGPARRNHHPPPQNPKRGLKYRKPKDLRRGKQEPPPKERQGILYPPLNTQELLEPKRKPSKGKEGGRRKSCRQL